MKLPSCLARKRCCAKMPVLLCPRQIEPYMNIILALSELNSTRKYSPSFGQQDAKCHYAGRLPWPREGNKSGVGYAHTEQDRLCAMKAGVRLGVRLF